MTFVAPQHRKDKIHKHGHMHLDDYVERRERFENECDDRRALQHALSPSPSAANGGQGVARHAGRQAALVALDAEGNSTVDVRWPASPSEDPGRSSPRALYIHIPFCRRRCGYCNFTVAAARDDLHARYAEVIRREIRQRGGAGEGGQAALRTLFLGGGTPTQMSDAHLASLLEDVRGAFSCDRLEETTLEANPEDLTPQRIKTLASLGFQRISLGVQSFQPDKLKTLEREHDAVQARQAAEAARAEGLQVAIDLIFAAPGETCEQWRRDLDEVLALRPDHVLTYGMTLERVRPSGGDSSEAISSRWARTRNCGCTSRRSIS